MRVKQLIQLLLECDLSADVVVVNKNDETISEFDTPSKASKLVTDAVDLDDGTVVVYFAGDTVRAEEDDG